MEYRRRALWVLSGTVLAILLVLPVPVRAQEEAVSREGVESAAGEGHLFRGALRGVSISEFMPGRNYLCGELILNSRLAIAGCGTGSGFIAPTNAKQGAEVAHFRLDWTALTLPNSTLILGAGLTEVELGPDQSGFRFSPVAEADDAEAAGGEVVLGLDIPVTTQSGHLRLRTDAGLAWVPGLPSISQHSAIVPFGTLTANVEF